MLLVLPQAPKRVGATLGQWLARNVSKNRNMARFLLPKADALPLYDDRNLIILARCALLANEWKGSEPQYKDLHTRFDRDLRKRLSDRFDRYALLASWDYQSPEACTFHIEAHRATGSSIPGAVEAHIRDNFFAPEDFEAFIVEASERSDTMAQVLSLLRDPSPSDHSLPSDNLIPYLGDQTLYERVLRVAANDKVAINRDSDWHCPQSGQSSDEAFRMLKQRATPTGWDWNSIYLGTPSEARGGAITAPTAATGTVFGGYGAAPAGTMAQPPTGTTTVAPPPTEPPTTTTGGGSEPTPTPSAQHVTRQSLGPKTGVNLLGDLEKWALPDKQRVRQTTLTFHGLSIKEVRDLCTKLPPKVQGELHISLPPDRE